MLAGVPIDDLEFKDSTIIEDLGVRAVNIRIFGIRSHAQLSEQRGNNGAVVGN
jgi:hypothetical protein